MKKRVLIAGCGDIGTSLGQLLSDHGHVVWGLRRRHGNRPSGIRPISADLTAPDLCRYLPPDLTDIIYTAAASDRSDRAYAHAYVSGLDNLLRTLEAQRQPVRRVIFTSSTAVYESSDGRWVTEETETVPTAFSGRRLLEAEHRLRQGPYPTTIVRLAGIYGEGRTGLLDRIASGQVRLPVTPRYANRIHRDDCVAVLCHLFNLEDPEPIYIGVDHDPADLRDVFRWLAQQLGVSLRVEEADGDRRPYSHKRCSNNRLTRSGYVFRYPSYRDGYGPIIGRYRSAESHGSDDTDV